MNNKFLKIGIVIALAVAIGFVLSFKFGNRNNMEISTDKTEVKVEKASQTPLPKLIDLGAGECIPCKMMAPILTELKSEYEGMLDIVVIDVWKNPFEAQKYGIRVIPTQIFYDANGQEFFRHEGFLSKEEILRKFKSNFSF
jgi:thioredoxin 1